MSGRVVDLVVQPGEPRGIDLQKRERGGGEKGGEERGKKVRDGIINIGKLKI